VVKPSEVVRRHEEWIETVDGVWGWKSNLAHLPMRLAATELAAKKRGEVEEASRLHQVGLSCAALQDTINSCLILGHRLDLMEGMSREGDIDQTTFEAYSMVDVFQFHTFLVSAFGYLAEACARHLGKRKKADSLPDLIEWLEAPEGKEPRWRAKGFMPGEKLIDARDWVDDIREVRNPLIHRGARVFAHAPERDVHRGLPSRFSKALGRLVSLLSGRRRSGEAQGPGFVFDVFQPGAARKVPEGLRPPEVMFNKNTVVFRNYACLHLCHLLSLAEEVASHLKDRVAHYQIGRNSRVSYAGCRVLSHWCARFLDTTSYLVPRD